jgi:hypothetical protein
MKPYGIMFPTVKVFVLLLVFLTAGTASANPSHSEVPVVTDSYPTRMRLQEHLSMLTRTIGERSVRIPENLDRTAAYIHSYFESKLMPVRYEPYRYRQITVNNVVATLKPAQDPSVHYIVGAHYDSVAGTVGADDNASAIAVQLETARQLSLLASREKLDVMVTFVSFALEEPPVYGSRSMGSRIYAEKAKKEKMQIDGMICLEMVGYSCRRPGCQRYPFPLMFFGYPRDGQFIGLVGNFSSRPLVRGLAKAFKKNPQLPVISLTVPFNGWLVPNVRLSDHASFWDHGYQAVMITDSAFYRNPHYHLASDTMETLDIEFMAELVESLVEFFRADHSIPD